MRIAFVLPALPMGGAEQVVRLLAREMQRQHEVLVISAYGGGPLAAVLEAEGIPLRVLEGGRRSKQPLRWLRAMRQSVQALQRVLADFRPDVVNVHMLGPGLDTLLAARLAGVRRVFLTLHNTYPEFASSQLRDRLRRPLTRWLLGRFRAVIAVSDEVRDWALRYRMVAPERVHTVQNGIDLGRFLRQEARGVLRARHSLSAEDVVFTTVASLRPKKGHSVLLEAIALLPEALRQRATFLVVGEGELRPALEAQARALGLTERVRFLGLRHDIPELLALSDAFVLPSHYEGLPLALLEAMAAGLCIVSTRVAGSTLLIRHGENGLLVEPNQPAALSEQLATCIEHPEMLQALGQAARQVATERYSAEQMARATAALFAQLTVGGMTL